jgi:hypothetical protein
MDNLLIYNKLTSSYTYFTRKELSNIIIENRTNTHYLIRCDKCGNFMDKHIIYCKQYGDEFWFNPPLVCSCGNSSKIIYIKDLKSVSYTENILHRESDDSIPKRQDTNFTKQNNTSYVLDMFKGKHFDDKAYYPYKELERIKVENEKLINKLKEIEEKNFELILENQKYKSVLTEEHHIAIKLKEFLKELKIREMEVSKKISYKESQIIELQKKEDKLKNAIVVLEDEVLYQSFGLYTPLYDFATAEEYKEKLTSIREKQKNMIKQKTAAVSNTCWTVNGSKQEGNKMTNDNITQLLRNFNIECENAIDRVKFNNFESMYSRIEKSFEKLNNLNETNEIAIEQSYLDLKFEELSLAYEYQLKKQEEKDEIRMLREQQREEAKLAKEIEEKRKEIEKEQQHYTNALQRIEEQISVEKSEERINLLISKRQEIKDNLEDLELVLKEIDYREANQKAGYVYIISNIGAFGENVYKIGMTRRLDPQERIDELGGASVPFRFDIHAIIFSNDAPRLESTLHRAFENNKINTINTRKEFFNVTLKEIEEIVRCNHDKTVNFVKIPPAQQYRESIKTRQINKKK